jgi:hypothetical protein
VLKTIRLRERAKLQWLQDLHEINGVNVSNKRREASRNFRKRGWEYLREKIDTLATNSKNRNIRHV